MHADDPQADTDNLQNTKATARTKQIVRGSGRPAPPPPEPPPNSIPPLPPLTTFQECVEFLGGQDAARRTEAAVSLAAIVHGRIVQLANEIGVDIGPAAADADRALVRTIAQALFPDRRPTADLRLLYGRAGAVIRDTLLKLIARTPGTGSDPRERERLDAWRQVHMTAAGLTPQARGVLDATYYCGQSDRSKVGATLGMTAAEAKRAMAQLTKLFDPPLERARERR